jgi:hypothetical protein
MSMQTVNHSPGSDRSSPSLLRRTVGARADRTRGFVRLVCMTSLLVSVLLGGTVTRASASTIIVQQEAPLTGTTVAGDGFSSSLQVSGGTGSVTYKQTSGAPDIAVSGTGLLTAPTTLAAGTYTASGTDADVGGAGSWEFTLTIIAAAPPGFAATAVNVYQSVYDYDQDQGQAGSIQTPTQYKTQISQLSPDDLAVFYKVVSQQPEWFQIPAIIESISSAGANSPVNASNRPQSGAKSKASHATANDASGANSPVQFYVPNGKANNYSDSASGCAWQQSEGDAAIFGLQIILDVATSVYNVSTLNGLEGNGLGQPLASLTAAAAFAIGFVADGLLLVAQIAHDATVYESLKPAECQQNDALGYGANIDNTTVQTYNLMTNAIAGLVQVQSTASTTDQDVQTVESELTSFQTSLGDAIAQNAQAIESALGSDSQGIISQLQTDNNALEQDSSTVQSTLAQMQSTLGGQLGSEISSDTAPLLTTAGLNSAVTTILGEIDGQAQTEVEDLTLGTSYDFNQLNDGINGVYTFESRTETEQLKLDIESILLSTSSAAPPDFEVPGSDGGLLTTPNTYNVSVADIVTTADAEVSASGVTIPTATTTVCADAKSDLSASNWQQAYFDFRTCYQDLNSLS